MRWLQVFKIWPRPITVTTVLLALSVMWWALFSLGIFGDLGMPFFAAVAFPMQLAVIGMGFFLMTRWRRNPPESAIRSVPIPVRIIAPVAVALGALQFGLLPTYIPAQTPSGATVRSFNASVAGGVCVAVYNRLERVTEPLPYCAAYQSHFDRVFAGGWLLLSAVELWGAWAIYGGSSRARARAL
jgi:hypothetical protein